MGVALQPVKEWEASRPKAEDANAPVSYRLSMIFYAVISDQIEQVIEFFSTPAGAEAMLEEVLGDEPD